MTRTVCIGKADDDMKHIYNIVLSAQLRVLDELRPGMKCKDVDSIARDYIRNAGYGDYFGHGLGHGVGLYIHESPAFNTRDESIIKPNMIETDEPGIYLPGKYGVRIEDMILITEDGCEPLAKSPKELVEL
jgi:Xaa-Pro aminopeptidase